MLWIIILNVKYIFSILTLYNVISSCDQSWIFSIITPVIGVISHFRNHSNMLISRNIDYYYQCWKQLCCFIFLWKSWYIFQVSLINVQNNILKVFNLNHQPCSKKKNLTDTKLLNGGVCVHFLYMFQAIFLMIILTTNIIKYFFALKIVLIYFLYIYNLQFCEAIFLFYM